MKFALSMPLESLKFASNLPKLTQRFAIKIILILSKARNLEPTLLGKWSVIHFLRNPSLFQLVGTT